MLKFLRMFWPRKIKNNISSFFFVEKMFDINALKLGETGKINEKLRKKFQKKYQNFKILQVFENILAAGSMY